MAAAGCSEVRCGISVEHTRRVSLGHTILGMLRSCLWFHNSTRLTHLLCSSNEQYQNYPSYHTSQSHQSLAALVSTPPSPTLSSEWVQPGSIARLHERDDADIWRGWRRWIFRFVPFLTFANTSLYLTYLGLRIACVVLAQRAQGTTFPGAWIFIGIEIVVAIPSQMHNFWTMLAMKKRTRAKLRLIGNEVPTVDVFVTCCGEEDEVILDTVRAACEVDYPRDRFRVILLDDAGSSRLEAAIGNLAVNYYNLYYMAREKIPGVPHHFKAGNLNYGLEQTHLLPGGAGQFMAALDADMVIMLLSGTAQIHPSID